MRFSTSAAFAIISPCCKKKRVCIRSVSEVRLMRTKEEILRILQEEKPELIRRYGLKRLALFGSYARDDQREGSDVDVMVEVEPSIGLRFVEMADRIEDALGIRTEVVSRRAIKPRYWEVI